MENNEIIECPICFDIFGIFDIDKHFELCCVDVKDNNILQTNTTQSYIEPTLTECQKNAYKYCKKKSKIHSDQTKGLVLIRFLENGYEEKHVDMVINNIKNNVRVTINIRVQTILENMSNDTHIKNGYEIKKFNSSSLHCARTTWENNLFNKIYDKAEPYERVKYGALNIFNEVNGISSCTMYGESFFILKNELKNRISFVCGDSSSQMLHICTFKYCDQLLIHPSNDHFKAIVDNVIYKKHSKGYAYIEAQIHGPVRLNFDIEKFCIKQSVFLTLKGDDKEKLAFFCNKNNIELVILDC